MHSILLSYPVSISRQSTLVYFFCRAHNDWVQTYIVHRKYGDYVLMFNKVRKSNTVLRSEITALKSRLVIGKIKQEWLKQDLCLVNFASICYEHWWELNTVVMHSMDSFQKPHILYSQRLPSATYRVQNPPPPYCTVLHRSAITSGDDWHINQSIMPFSFSFILILASLCFLAIFAARLASRCCTSSRIFCWVG